MKDSDYIIIGDTEKYKDCLICVCSGSTYEDAKMELDRMKNNPTEKDKRLIKGYSNLRIEKVPVQECWWRNV